jgi:hypothetical protein
MSPLNSKASIIVLVKVLIFISFSSCTQSFLLDPGDKLIINTWVMTGYQQDQLANTFSSSKLLVPGKYGYQFYEDGQLIVRHHLGSCSTGPLEYQDIDATWVYGKKNRIDIYLEVPDSLREIIYEEHSLEVIELDNHQMTAKIIY